MNHEELHDTYFDYVGNATESPLVYHRWCLATTTAAHMGARITIPMGFFNIRAHLFIQLLGRSGSRKSSAIRIMRRMSKDLGLINIAPKQISREALISLLSNLSEENVSSDDSVGDMLAGKDVDFFTDLLIPADEFNAFVGDNKDAYMLQLSQFWDEDEDYDKKLQGTYVRIERPYINMMSGNTFSGFSDCFSGGNALGMGMLTRMIVVPWASARPQIAFPPPPDKRKEAVIKDMLRSAFETEGVVQYAKGSKAILADIYANWKLSAPASMDEYTQRRFTHLLKLCSIFATMDGSLLVTTDIVYNANTMLAANEQHMSRTFTFVFVAKEVGAAMNFITDYLTIHPEGVSMGELSNRMHNVCSTQNLLIALSKLQASKRVKYSDSAKIYFSIPDLLNWRMGKYLNLDFLTPEEREEFKIAKKPPTRKEPQAPQEPQEREFPAP